MFLRYPLSLLLITYALVSSCGKRPDEKQPAIAAEESQNPFEDKDKDIPPSNGASLWDCGEYIDRANPPDTLKVPD